jgi:hypothetical protein
VRSISPRGELLNHRRFTVPDISVINTRALSTSDGDGSVRQRQNESGRLLPLQIVHRCLASFRLILLRAFFL